MSAQPRMARLTLALAVLLGLYVVLPATATAQGSIAIYPVQIDLPDGLRGAEYFRSVTVMNSAEGDLRLSVTPVGELGTWLSVFAADDLSVALEETIVPPQSESEFMIRIVVPEDAPNALHQGGIQFQGEAHRPDGAEAGLGASIGIGVLIIVDVTGTQNLSGVVQDAWVNDIEVDRPPARLQVLYENNGNVQATPVINWEIRDAGGNVVGNMSHDETLVRPGETAQIVVEWDSTGQPEGLYSSDLSVLLGNDTLDQRQLDFDILPYGTLTRDGVLDGIRLEGDPRPGGLAMFAGIFRNTGEIDTTAVFSAEVYHDEQLIEVVESRERVVIVGEQARLDATFEVPEEGDYMVRGKVYYEGRETDAIELEFTAVASEDPPGVAGIFATDPPAQESSMVDQPWTLLLIAGLGMTAAVGGIAFVFGRSRGAPVTRHKSPVSAQGQQRSSEP